MRYSSEDINILIRSIKDYKILQGIVNSFKNNGASFEDMIEVVEKLPPFSLSGNGDETDTEKWIDFYYNSMILTIYKNNENYELQKGIQVIDKDGNCIGDYKIEDMEKVFHDYTWSRIENYVDNIDTSVLKQDFQWYKVNDKLDLKQAIFESVWSCNGNDFDVKYEVDKFDKFIEMQEKKKETGYSRYDIECMIYLSLEIMKYLNLQDRLYIDLYQEEIVKIYEDYKQHDDNNVSLLDSIDNYIRDNETTLRNRITKAFDGAF